ncbi:CsiV family protein [SAR86 cluster bacterium]|nr:CsiV family protein [SAR86 cluster bacterium]
MHLKLAIIALFISESLYSIDFNEYLEKYLVDKQKLDHIKVDFFIIQNLSIEDEDLEEKWKELDELELSNHLIKIKTEPTTFVTFPEGKFSDEITLPPLKFKIQPEQQSLSDEVAEVTKPDPFLYEKIPFQKEMEEIENNLNRSRDYRVIYYNSWYQPVFKENETIPIFIDAQKKDKKVHGEIKIYKERFIHLVSKLRFSQKTEEIDNTSRTQEIKTFQSLIKDKNYTESKGFLNDNYWVETIFNSVKVNLKYIGDFVYSYNEINSEEIIELPRFKFVDLYEIDKDVKLDVDELNFIDHPYFSILIKVTEQTK